MPNLTLNPNPFIVMLPKPCYVHPLPQVPTVCLLKADLATKVAPLVAFIAVSHKKTNTLFPINRFLSFCYLIIIMP